MQDEHLCGVGRKSRAKKDRKVAEITIVATFLNCTTLTTLTAPFTIVKVLISAGGFREQQTRKPCINNTSTEPKTTNVFILHT